VLTLVVTLSLLGAPESDPEGRDFFEKKIRPVLVEHCYKCHSTTAKKLRGKLLLDSGWGWQQGGESGAVILPGEPQESLLISALRYDKFQMPPKAKLPASVVADFVRWIDMGAPDPRARKTRDAHADDKSDLAERKKWWSLQPVRTVDVPEVEQKSWPRGDIDRFVLSRLEARGWRPAAAAKRESWLRRVTYDLTGLPPAPGELHDFVEDTSTAAYETVVDRLLRSPHFGEQWARHWMDLVRYAETKAFEADYPMPNAFHYRDYLIRAFNSDVPYDQLVREAIAGDLIEPRLNPETGINESVIGPGYLYLTDGQHGPPDIHADEARVFDDMIDVVGKTFLGHTLACARCHDHKFDAITTKDYYSLYGVIASSRIDYADINPPRKQATARDQLREKKIEIRRALADAVAKDLRTVHEDLIAVQAGDPTTPEQKRWAEALKKKPNEVFKALSILLEAKDEAAITSVWSRLRGAEKPAKPPLGKLGRTEFGEWLTSGVSFEDAPRPAGDFVVAASGDRAVAAFAGGRPAAGHLASRFAGAIRSPTFKIEGESVSVRVKGKNVRVSLYVRHYELIGRGPTTGGTTKVINSDRWKTVRFATRLWIGEPAYIEVQHNGGQMNFAWGIGGHVDGSWAVLDSATVNGPLRPLPGGSAWGVQSELPTTPTQVLELVAARVAAIPDAWRSDRLTVDQGDLLDGLFTAGVIDLRAARTEALQVAVAAYRKMQSGIPAPTYVRSLADGHGIDEPVYIRGAHRNPSPAPNPRHFLDVLDARPFQAPGSGRLQWAESLLAASNPVTARVMANRIWHHLFGRGIVSSVDDFGHMGEKPSHPKLLDHIASKFVRNDWSVKRLIREITLSSTYRLSTRGSAAALRDDPENKLLQHMPVRRLQAEQVRDTLLAVSGELDRKLFGPSQKGDGGNRRSVYIQLRRRYMPEFLMTFDMPNATETFGRRNVTAGPAQSLAILNGSLSWKAAERWARRIASSGKTTFAERVDLLHRQAFGRGATKREIEWARGVLSDLEADESAVSFDHWKELCHTMLNRKELIYVH